MSGAGLFCYPPVVAGDSVTAEKRISILGQRHIISIQATDPVGNAIGRRIEFPHARNNGSYRCNSEDRSPQKAATVTNARQRIVPTFKFTELPDHVFKFHRRSIAQIGRYGGLERQGGFREFL